MCVKKLESPSFDGRVEAMGRFSTLLRRGLLGLMKDCFQKNWSLIMSEVVPKIQTTRKVENQLQVEVVKRSGK